MNIFSVAGYKNSGKSTLCRTLLAILRERGMKAGYIKRTHEGAASPQGTDSGEALRMGMDVLVWGKDSLCFESPRQPQAEISPRSLACRFFPDADVIILEGGKELALPKIWVALENEEIPDYPGIFAVYDRFASGDKENKETRFGRGEEEMLASRIESVCCKKNASVRVYVDDAEIAMKDFVSDFIEGGVRGMLGSLKGVPDGGRSGNLKIYIGGK